MKVLVTGGSGFIGSHVVEYFSQQGEEVLALDNQARGVLLGKGYSKPSYNWDYVERLPRVTLIAGDVRDASKMNALAKNIDLIVHTAGQVAVTTSVTDPRNDFEVNALGAYNVLEAARKSNGNPAVVYMSTNKVYGTNVNRLEVEELQNRYSIKGEFRRGIPEDFSVDGCEHTPYGCSKLLGDIYAQEYGYTYGLKTAVLRMSCIYGERQMGVEDQGWLAWFAIANITGRPITIYGDGKQVRDVLYVKDLVRLIDSFERTGIKGSHIFNVGGGPENTLSLLELLETIESLTTKKTTLSYSDWRPSDQKIYVSDIHKAGELLNWSPKTNTSEGVEKLVAWVTANANIFSSTER